MKEVIRIGGKLAAICAVAAISLGIVNAVTEPIIIAARETRLKEALSELSLGMSVGEYAESLNQNGITGYYPLSGIDGVDAYIIKVTGAGYAGDMEILTAISIEGEVLSAVLMDHSETPGLGKEAENASYMEMYIGTGKDSVIPSSKRHLSPKDSDAVTGASITFIAIGKALNEASKFVIQMGGM